RAQRPPRRHARPARAEEGGRRRWRRRAPRRGGAPETDRRACAGDRQPAQGQGAGDPRGLNVAIIMDGNARWAKAHGVPVLQGHRRGAQTLKETVKSAVRLGIDELTVYAFSTENWARPTAEVRGLMRMFAELIDSETPELDEQGVRMRFVGRRDEVSKR